jgi:hypothetical protein
MSWPKPLSRRLLADLTARCPPGSGRRRLWELKPVDLLVACDHYEEYGGALAPDVLSVPNCRLVGLFPGLARALDSRLPHATREYAVYRGYGQQVRRCSVWQLDAVWHVLTFLGVTPPATPIRYWPAAPPPPAP